MRPFIPVQSILVAGLASSCFTASASAQSQRSSDALGELRDRYPGVLVEYARRSSTGEIDPWIGASRVHGVRMPASGLTGRDPSSTPEIALRDWFTQFWEVFAGDGELAATQVSIHNVAVLDESRSVVTFTQQAQRDRAGGEVLQARGAFGRAVVDKVGESWAVSHVAWSGLDVPVDGLGDPLISEAAALAIAETSSSAARAGQELHWTGATLIAIGNQDADRPRDARLAWQVRGLQTSLDERGLEAFVDAATGDIIDERYLGAAAAHASKLQSITGGVNGSILQGDVPFDSGTLLPCISYTTSTGGLAKMKVNLLNSQGSVIASTFTDDTGGFTFTGNPVASATEIEYTREHEFMAFAEITDIQTTGVGSSFMITNFDWDVMAPDTKSVSAPALISYQYDDTRTTAGPVPETEITDASAWRLIDDARSFYRTRLGQNTTYTGLDDDDLRVIPSDEIMIDVLRSGRGAAYWDRTDGLPGEDPLFGVPVITISAEGETIRILPPRDVPNRSDITVVTHEYAHFALDEAFGIDYTDNGAIHEGYADILGILMYDTDVIGVAGLGCTDGPFRDWSVIEPAWTSAQNCKCCQTSDIYRRGQHLVIIWRELVAQLRTSLGTTAGLDEARDLFVAWSLLATPDPFPRPLCLSGDRPDRSVRDDTLIEVLTADDDNNTLNDGTPNIDEICAAFEAYGITSTFCPDSAGSRCAVDFDGDGQFGLGDVLMFDEWISEQSLRADLNADGQVDLFDRLALLDLGLACR